MSQQTPQQPIKVFRIGLIEVAIWQNEVEQAEEGKPRYRFSIKPEKEYKDAKGNFRPTPYYFLEELPRLVVLLVQAYVFIVLKQYETEARAA